MPHYNHGRYVEGAVAAILSQSVAPLELILIDDASTDGSGPVLEKLAKDPRVKLIRRPENKGIFANLVEGFTIAKGDFVFGPAADDSVLPGLFEKSLDLLGAHPGAGLCSSLVGMLAEDGRDLGLYDTPVIRSSPSYISPEAFRREQSHKGNWVTTYSAIYRRDAVLAMLTRVPDMNPGLDGFLIHSLGAKYGVCFLPERLAMWRRLEMSAAGRLGRDATAGMGYADRLTDGLRAVGTHTESELAALRRRGYEEVLNSLAHAEPYQAEAARLVASRLPGSGPWLAAYKSVMASGAGPAATRIYLFPRRPLGEMARIAMRKIFGR